MDQENTHKLNEVTMHHCELLYRGELTPEQCAIAHITPSGRLFFNKNIRNITNLPWDQFVRLEKEINFPTQDISSVLIHWNRECEKLNQGFREGWRFNFNLYLNQRTSDMKYITYDMNYCRAHWLQLIRLYRNSALRQLDIEFTMALEQSDSEAVEEIGLIKNLLRDLPKNIDMLQYDTYESLVTFWPTILLPAPDFVAPKPIAPPRSDDV